MFDAVHLSRIRHPRTGTRAALARGRAGGRTGARDADPPARRQDRAGRPRRPAFVAGARGRGRIRARGLRPLRARPRRRADSGALPRAPPRSRRRRRDGHRKPQPEIGQRPQALPRHGQPLGRRDPIAARRGRGRRLRDRRRAASSPSNTSRDISTTSLSRFTFRKRFRVAVDCGNGVMGPVVLEAFRRLGFDVLPLFCEPDGDFPNHIPDPEVPAYMEALRAKVVSARADAGPGLRRRRRPRGRDRRARQEDLGGSPRRGLRRGDARRVSRAGSSATTSNAATSSMPGSAPAAASRGWGRRDTRCSRGI